MNIGTIDRDIYYIKLYGAREAFLLCPLKSMALGKLKLPFEFWDQDETFVV